MPDNPLPQHFKVPREDRSLLSIPSLEKANDLVEENRKLFNSVDCFLHGRSLQDLRSAARISAINAAREFSSFLLHTPLPDVPIDSCVLSGHQPELFHVGVWAKNFTLAGIARRTRSVPINLVIDNDALGSTSVRLPVGTRDHLRTTLVPFDTPRPPIPWEEAEVLDRSLLEQFGDTVGRTLRTDWGFNPLIESAWGSAINSVRRSNRLCDGLTGFRTNLEREWGLQNLELPMSKLCETEPFLWFVAHLIMRLPEFHQIYNESVVEYRQAHRLRNRMQPVPDLERQTDWLEAPFWVWQRGESDRGRLFVRQVGSVCEMKYGDNHFATIPYMPEGSLDTAVQILNELPQRGIRLRTRALTTTLFARTCLSDLFVHGIGGAKYDAMTDQICEQFFGFRAPSYMTISATLYLPLGQQFPVTTNQLHEVERRRRDLNYNPDRYLTDPSRSADLIAEKQQLLTTAKQMRDTQQLRGRLTHSQHTRLTEIRTELFSRLEPMRQELNNERTDMLRQLAANELLRNREYSFALYPTDLLRDFLLPLAGE